MLKTMFGKPEKNPDGQFRIEAAIDGFMTSYHQRGHDAAFAKEFELVQEWQTHRLLLQYEHLFENERTSTVAHFMLNEVYSGDRLASISNEIKKTAQKAWRLVPADMLSAAANAIEAHYLTVQIDEKLALKTLSSGGMNNMNGSTVYIAALRDPDILSARHRQLQQFSALSKNIEEYLNRKSLHLGLKMTSGIARKAGVSNLHQFLMKSCTLLRNSGGFNDIVDEIFTTELDLLHKIEAGENPFEFMDLKFKPLFQVGRHM